MLGDRWTKIPPGLDHPAHWLDDADTDPKPVKADPPDEVSDIAKTQRLINENRDALLLLTTDLKLKIGAYRGTVQASNSLGEDAKLGLQGMLDGLTDDVDAIAQNLPAPGEPTSEAQAKVVLSRGQRAIQRLEYNLNEYFAVENLMDAAVPIGIILGFGVAGALIAGAVGFGAGGLVGKLIVKHLKPGDAMDEAAKL
ncbi:MAG: hypothetical protein ACFBRM_02350 [Pikeienuella sp.]